MNKRAYTEGYMLKTSLELPISKGDVLLGGRFKNQRIIVDKLAQDSLGQYTVNDKKLLNFRIEKLLPKNKQSKETQMSKKAEETSASTTIPSPIKGVDAKTRKPITPSKPVGQHTVKKERGMFSTLMSRLRKPLATPKTSPTFGMGIRG